MVSVNNLFMWCVNKMARNNINDFLKISNIVGISETFINVCVALRVSYYIYAVRVAKEMLLYFV